MPTRYTEKIAEGDITFEEYVWICSEKYGVHVDKDKHFPSTKYIDHSYESAMLEAEERLRWLSGLPKEERAAAYDAEWEERIVKRKELSEKRQDLRKKYKAMLDIVTHWDPPRPYRELREHMRDQIIQSIRYDCASPYPLGVKVSPETWYKLELKQAGIRATRTREKYDEHVRQVEEHNEWVENLWNLMRQGR